MKIKELWRDIRMLHKEIYHEQGLQDKINRTQSMYYLKEMTGNLRS